MTEDGRAAYEADVLIVDDTPANLKLLTGMLKDAGFKVRAAPNGKLALAAAERDVPDLILLDINMPDMSGYEVCTQLKANPRLRSVPVIFISALAETMDKVKAFGTGGVDYVTKPFQFDEVLARVRTHLELRRLQHELERYNKHLQDLVAEQVEEIADSHMATILAMSKLAESRDDDTGKHLERTQTYCRLLAQALAPKDAFSEEIDDDFIENIFHASPLHDIGKVAIPDRILQKPGKLTDEEFALMKSHTLRGSETLFFVAKRYPNNAFLNMGLDIARWHHEKWDGSGYPDGLRGEDIPLPARIMAVADVYDALTSRRCYKEAFSHEKSREILREGRGAHFDPSVLDAFLEVEAEFDRVRREMGN